MTLNHTARVKRLDLPLHCRLGQFTARLVAELVTSYGEAASRRDHDHEEIFRCPSPLINSLVA